MNKRAVPAWTTFESNADCNITQQAANLFDLACIWIILIFQSAACHLNNINKKGFKVKSHECMQLSWGICVVLGITLFHNLHHFHELKTRGFKKKKILLLSANYIAKHVFLYTLDLISQYFCSSYILYCHIRQKFRSVFQLISILILMEKNAVSFLSTIMLIITGTKWMLSAVDIVLMNTKEPRNNIWVKYTSFKEKTDAKTDALYKAHCSDDNYKNLGKINTVI